MKKLNWGFIGGLVFCIVVWVLVISAMAQPMSKVLGTPNVSGIKAVTPTSQAQATTYKVPFISTADKADGSGPVDIVTYQKITKTQLEQVIARGNQTVTIMQKQIKDAQEQLDKINSIEAEPVKIQ
jgi:TolA-binding protein